LESARKRQLSTLAKRKSKLVTMQDRLLNAYLTNTIDEATYNVKSAELKSDSLKAEEEIEKLNDVQTLDADLGLKLFDWRQNVAELWLSSNNRQKREILDLLCLNRAMSDVSLLLANRKPFDFLSERLKCQSSRHRWQIPARRADDNLWPRADHSRTGRVAGPSGNHRKATR
jgi:hypothetical protein